ncbi:MAG: threonine--tRNA ligase [Planctomycetes bacterium]|nr:threonine--tRNA ligase [Planctomycetota bacterium]
MPGIKVELPDRGAIEIERPLPAREVLSRAGLPAGAVAVLVDGRLADLSRPIDADCRIEPVALASRAGRAILSRSAALVLAQAAARLFPGVELAALAVTAEGFSVDLDLEHVLRVEDLPLLEEEMRKIQAADLVMERIELPREEAERELRRQRSRFRMELFAENADDPVSFVRIGDALEWDAGPTLPSTSRTGHFRLLSASGAYWRDSETRPVLQRVHGTAFPEKEELEAHLARLEQARERDHRKLGRELDLFSFHPEAQGSPFWHPRGVRLLATIENYLLCRLAGAGYEEIRTPAILSESVWRTSGHWEIYRENMFLTESRGKALAVKPMNCPGAAILFRSKRRSYRELPVRFAELGLVHRNERSGVLSGLLRVRSFTQDDAHIFCSATDLSSEIRGTIELVRSVYRDFGFDDPVVELSTRPAVSIGSEDTWREAEAALAGALGELGIAHEVHRGEGSFYGPKIDFHVADCLGRLWQVATIQVDFAMPERFELSFVGPDGRHRRPVMIHRAVLGSLERFVALLLEHHAGAFPPWLAPEQARIVPVSPPVHAATAEAAAAALAAAGLRAGVDSRDETVAYRVREAARERIPYTLVVGDAELKACTVSVRRRDGTDVGAMPAGEFVRRLSHEVASRAREASIG